MTLIVSLWVILTQLFYCRLEVIATAPPQPVGFYPLNELYGTLDITGNELPAGYPSQVQLSSGPDGKPKGSYSFAGNSNSYIEIPYHQDLDTRKSITILAWVNVEAGASGPIVEYTTGNSSWAVHFWMATKVQLFLRLMKRNLDWLTHIAFDFPSYGVWRHVGATYDYSSGAQKLYGDGIKVAESNIGQVEIATNYKIRVGHGLVASSSYKGRISCIQIYNMALTEAQIQEAKNSCFNMEMPKPVGIYPLNSLHGTKDTSGNNLPAGDAFNVQLADGLDGKPGGSYYLTGNANSYIEIPYHKKLDTRYSITILAWVLPEARGPIVQYSAIDKWGLHFWALHTNPFTLYGRMVLRGNIAAYPVSRTFSTSGIWRYVAFSYQYSTGSQKIFENGVQVAENNVGINEIATQYKIRIGNVSVDESRIYKGRVACVMFYNTALLAEHIKQMKNSCFHTEYAPCFNYRLLDASALDQTTWYRFSGNQVTKITNHCPASGTCGTQSPGWINGSHPNSTESSSMPREVCYRVGADCCGYKARVDLRRCYGYYVYKFTDLPSGDKNTRICGEKDPEEPPQPDFIFEETPRQYFSNHVIYTESRVPTPAICMGYCLVAGEKCESVNFINQDVGTCQLNNATALQYSQDMRESHSSSYYTLLKVSSYIVHGLL